MNKSIEEDIALGFIDPKDYNGKFDPIHKISRLEGTKGIAKSLEE